MSAPWNWRPLFEEDCRWHPFLYLWFLCTQKEMEALLEALPGKALEMFHPPEYWGKRAFTRRCDPIERDADRDYVLPGARRGAFGDVDLNDPNGRWPNALVLTRPRFDARDARMIARAHRGMLSAVGHGVWDVPAPDLRHRTPVFLLVDGVLKQVHTWHPVDGEVDKPDSREYEEACLDATCTRGPAPHAPVWIPR